MSLRRHALFLAGLFVAVSCSDAGNPLEPGQPKPQPKPVDALQVLQCSVSISTQSLQCAPPDANAGGASASGQIFTGGQNKYVVLTASNWTAAAGSLEFDVTVQSLMRQPLGTDDGVTLHPNGVRVWFAEDPVGQPSGQVTVGLESGTDILLVNPQPYFQYNTILQTNQTSAAKRWRFEFEDPPTENIYFKVYVVAHVQYENGWVEVTPPLDTLAPGETVDLDGIAYDVRADSSPTVSQTLTWGSSDEAVATVDAGTGLVTAVAAGTATITATNGTQSGTATIVVNTNPFVAVDTFPAITNVTIPEPVPGLLKGANDGDGQAVTVVPDTVTTSQGGTAWLNADGSLEYLSKAGFSGEDIISFEITDGVTRRPAHAVVEVAPSNYWYVQSGGTGDGRDRFPLGTLAQAQDSAAAGDSILVLDNGALTLDGPLALEAGQAIIGQGIPTSIVRTVNEQAVTILAAGTQPELTSATGSTVTLGTDNMILGVAIGSTAGAAGITGTTFGTLRMWYSNVAAAGPALVLSDGALDADSTVTVSSTGSAASGISLTNVTGSMTTTGGAISGAAGAAFDVSGGSVSVNYGGNVTQGNAAALLAVGGNHTGTLTFPGTLSATAGTGLQFNDADGSYNFTGTTTLNGGNAGVDIGNGSGGTFAFAAGTSITSPTGTAFSVNGSAPTVTYDGDITQANNALLVDVSEQPGGTVTFQTGTLFATAGTGILLSNADGSVSFLGTTTLNGGDAGVDVVAGSAGTFGFAAESSITNPSGPAFVASASAPASLSYAGTISVNASRPVVIDGGCGTIAFTGSITSTADGVLVQNCASGAVALNGAKTFTTGGNQAVTLASNGTASVSFGGGGLAITTTTGIGFGATGGGIVHVTGTNNTITTGTGTGLSLNGVSTGTSGLTFHSVSTGAAANGIALNNLTGVGVTVSGDGATAGSGGTISGTSGHGVSLTNLGSLTTGVVLNYLNVSAGAGGNAALFGSTFGPVSSTGTALSATGGPALNLSSGTMFGAFTTVSSSASTTTGVSLTNVVGSVSTTGGTIAGGAAGTAFFVSGGSVSGTIASTISQGNATRAAVEVAGGHNTGTLTFSGPVSATNGTGLQFLDADGTYTFTGNFSLNGAGDEGIDIGAASSGTVNVAPSAGNSAEIVSPSGIAIAVLGGNADLNYSGNVTQASNAALLSVAGGHNGDIAFPSGTLSATNGNGLQFDNADGTYNFAGTVTLGGGDAGIDVTNGSAGTFTFPVTASITSPNTGNLISILNSAPNFTYTGGLTKANNNVTGILISNNTGGTITFNGDATAADGDPADVARTISSGTAAAVNLSSNGGASINFNGGGLTIASGSGAGLTATGGGTVSVTGAGNTIASGTGTALSVQNTTIGASGLSFQSIAATGAANGIVLNNTGATNGLQVTGTGGAGSGGIITGTGGDAVLLTSARNIRLTSMTIQNSGGSGVYGSSVTNFSLRSSTVSANGNAVGEAGLEFDNLLGTDSVVNSTITGSAEDNLVVRNNTGTLDSLVVTGNTISSNSSIGSDGILVTAANTANATVRVRNNTFTANKGDHFQATASNSALLNVVLSQNTMTGGHPTALGQGVTLGTGLTFTGTFTYDLNDNDILNGPISNAITIDHDGTTGSLMQGRVRNNVIGTSGVDLSCSAQASGIEIENGNRGTHTYAVTGNTVRRCFDRGIFLDNGDGSNVVVNATVTGNTVNELTTANARQALYVNVGSFNPNFLGATDSFTVCADIQGNTLVSHPTFSTEAIRLRMRFDSRMNLPGYVGSFNNAASEVNAYLAARNTLTASATATTTAAGAPNGYYNIASCPTPP